MRLRLLVGASFVALLASGSARAQSSDSAPMEPNRKASDTASTRTMTGTVVSSTTSQLIIDTGSGPQQTFAVDDRSVLPSDLTAGSRVTVSYRDDKDMMSVAKVTLEPASTKPRSERNDPTDRDDTPKKGRR